MTSLQLEQAAREIGTARDGLRRSVSSSVLRPVVTLAELAGSCTGELSEVLEYAIENCVLYTLSVCKYKQALENGIDAEKLAEAEDSRGRIHNATIDALNALSRAQKRAGKDNTWIGSLQGNRAAYGKLALLLGFEAMETYQGRPQ